MFQLYCPLIVVDKIFKNNFLRQWQKNLSETLTWAFGSGELKVDGPIGFNRFFSLRCKLIKKPHFLQHDPVLQRTWYITMSVFASRSWETLFWIIYFILCILAYMIYLRMTIQFSLLFSELQFISSSLYPQMDTHHVLSLFGKEYSLLKRILIDTIQKYNSAFLAFGTLAERNTSSWNRWKWNEFES